MVRVLLFVRRLNGRFGLWFSSILSWPLWLPFIIVGSVFGIALHQSDLVMLLLTVQTSVDAAATKMLQNHVRAADEIREARNDQMLAHIKAQNEAAIRRDRQSAKRDKLIITAITAQNDLLQYLLEKGVAPYDSKRKAPSRAKPASRRNRPANRKKP